MGKLGKGKPKKPTKKVVSEDVQSQGELTTLLTTMNSKKLKRNIEKNVQSSSKREDPKKKKRKLQKLETVLESENSKIEVKRDLEMENEEDHDHSKEPLEDERVRDEADAKELGDDEDEEESDEDEEEDDDSGGELVKEEGTGEILDFDFEAFPMEEGDKDGIVNMLTQIFLRADVDTRGIAEALIAQSPLGNVIGPAESCADDESENVVYGILSTIKVQGDKVKDIEWIRDVVHLISQRAKKQAPKQIRAKFEEILKSDFGWIINERMLRFPAQIAPPMFASLQKDISSMKDAPEQFLYIQKLRVADAEKDAAPSVSNRKLGKAAKKRLAAEKLASCAVEFDNVEDALLLELPRGTAVYFDYPVEGEVEAGSKFHVQVRNGKKFRPFRRAILMDRARLDAFVEAVKNF